MPPKRVFVAGVGMTAFEKPRNRRDYDEIGREAAVKALLDAGITYDAVEHAFVGYCYGDSTVRFSQVLARHSGMTGIPIQNVNNNCSTGSSALYMARLLVQAGVSDCVMALGFEKMEPGSLGSKFDDRINPLERTMQLMSDVVGIGAGPFAAQIFGGGAQEYINMHEATWRHVASIAAKNHAHSVNNAYSQFRNRMTTEECLQDRKVAGEMTRAMCCPTSDGGACAIICSENFVYSHGLENQAIEIVGMASATDSPKLYEEQSMIELTGSDMTRLATRKALDQAGISINDVKVIEYACASLPMSFLCSQAIYRCHDCFAANELLLYDSLGLCASGQAHKICDDNDNTYGGKWVINPSGGLESKGHPLGATGIAMAFYLVTQLRGWAGPMQVKEVAPGVATAFALAHNLGLGGSCVVTVLARPEFYRRGECREISGDDEAKVRSQSFSPYARANL